MLLRRALMWVGAAAGPALAATLGFRVAALFFGIGLGDAATTLLAAVLTAAVLLSASSSATASTTPATAAAAAEDGPTSPRPPLAAAPSAAAPSAAFSAAAPSAAHSAAPGPLRVALAAAVWTAVWSVGRCDDLSGALTLAALAAPWGALAGQLGTASGKALAVAAVGDAVLVLAPLVALARIRADAVATAAVATALWVVWARGVGAHLPRTVAHHLAHVVGPELPHYFFQLRGLVALAVAVALVRGEPHRLWPVAYAYGLEPWVELALLAALVLVTSVCGHGVPEGPSRGGVALLTELAVAPLFILSRLRYYDALFPQHAAAVLLSATTALVLALPTRRLAWTLRLLATTAMVVFAVVWAVAVPVPPLFHPTPAPPPSALVPPPLLPSGAIYLLTQRKRLSMVVRLLHQLDRQFFAYHPHYPIIVFHDDLDAWDQACITAAVSAPVRFEVVALAVPPHIDASTLGPETPCGPHGIGYRSMCRFHAMEAFNKAALASYRYLWRLDDDSQLIAPVPVDVFAHLRDNGFLYGFSGVDKDPVLCVTDLWELTAAHVRSHHLNATFLATLPARQIIYNNFEVFDAAFFRTEPITSYLRAVDLDGGIYRHRWGDAPLRALCLAIAAPVDRIHRFVDVPYRHDSHIAHRIQFDWRSWRLRTLPAWHGDFEALQL